MVLEMWGCWVWGPVTVLVRVGDVGGWVVRGVDGDVDERFGV